MGGKVSYDGGRNKSYCLPFGHMTHTQAHSGVWQKHFPVISLHSASGKFSCYSQEQEKLKEMKEHLEESMSYHEKEIKHHEDAIRRHRKAMDKHQKGIEKLSDAESSDDEKK